MPIADTETQETRQQKIRLGLIGLGNIGAPMAKRLLSAGLKLTVYDLRGEAMKSFEALGVVAAKSATELAAQADVVSVAVLDDAQVMEVVLGKEGLLTVESPPQAILIHSTVAPSTCQKLAEEGDRRGVAVLDAQVSGGTPAAEAGTLTIMLGGDRDALPLVDPVIDALGSNVSYLGPSGAGALAKIINQLVLFSNLAVTHEAVALGVTGGLQEEKLVELLNSSTGRSWVTDNWRYYHRLMESHTLGPEGVVDFMLKDVWLGLEVARSMDCSVPFASMTSQMLQKVFVGDSGREGSSSESAAEDTGDSLPEGSSA